MSHSVSVFLPHRLLRLARICAFAAVAALPSLSQAGPQQYEPMSASIRAALHAAISDSAAPKPLASVEFKRWLHNMSERLEKRVPDKRYREELLVTIHYEATRAGLDPQLVLGLIQIESMFRKYAVSSAGARGYMQVMPFWIKVIGRQDDNLFHMRTNLRYGCTILRHYLDIEEGNLFRALGRYNGSLGKAQYPNLVRGAWERHWSYTPVEIVAEQKNTEVAAN